MMDWLREPGFFGTHATVGALFTALFVLGWFQARKRRADAHHWLMLGGMISMLSFFIAYYLFRQLGVLAFEGKEGFGGSQTLYDYVFIPVLTLHIILVMIGLVMAVYMIVLGFRSQQFVDGIRSLRESLLQTTWKKVGLILGGITVVVLGLFGSRVVTAGFSMRKFEVYLIFLLIVAFVFGIEMVIQRIWPNGGQRHRALGRFTMVIYCVLFVTGSFTYTMLYILYPGKIG